MRRLTSNEKRLALLFGCLIFLLINLFGWVALNRKQLSLQSDIRRLQGEEMEAKLWLDDRVMWEHRKKWLEDHQPRIRVVSEGSTKLLEDLQSSSQKLKITFAEQAFLEPTSKPSFQEVGVRLKISGSFDSVVKWLAEIQQPELFRVLSQLTLRADKDVSKIIGEIQIKQRYANSSE